MGPTLAIPKALERAGLTHRRHRPLRDQRGVLLGAGRGGPHARHRPHDRERERQWLQPRPPDRRDRRPHGRHHGARAAPPRRDPRGRLDVRRVAAWVRRSCSRSPDRGRQARRHRPLRASGSSSSVARPASDAAPRLAAAEAGAGITVVGRSAEKLAEVVTSAGTGTGDLRRRHRPRTVPRAGRRGGRRHGRPRRAPLLHRGVAAGAPRHVDADTWQRVIATNAIGPALVTQAALDRTSARTASSSSSRRSAWAAGTSASAPTRRARPRSTGPSNRGGRSTRSVGSCAWRWATPRTPTSHATSTWSTPRPSRRSGWRPR